MELLTIHAKDIRKPTFDYNSPALHVVPAVWSALRRRRGVEGVGAPRGLSSFGREGEERATLEFARPRQLAATLHTSYPEASANPGRVLPLLCSLGTAAPPPPPPTSFSKMSGRAALLLRRHDCSSLPP